MRKHRVEAGPDSVHWGFFDAELKPLITIDSGDTVTISTVSGTLGLPRPDSGLTVPPALPAIHDKVQAKLGGPHILTGPVAVRGAKAGQVLEVRIKAIELHQDWGYNTIRPLAGALPDDFKQFASDPHPARQAADDRQIAVGPRNRPQAVLRHHGGGAAGGLGHDQLAAAAARTAATSTTRSWSPAPRSICRSTPTARCSPAATATACKATARSASPRSRPA